MSKSTVITRSEQKLINAGMKAKALRQQLAVTYLASTEIIEAMKALRQGIPTVASIRAALEEEKAKELPAPDRKPVE